MADQSFDVLVVGGGSGLTAAYWAEADGKDVALVEPGPLGGTCVNRGCIPTKTLIQAAEVLDTIRSASDFGIDLDQESVRVDVASIFERMRRMRADNVASSDGWIEKSEQITLFRERGTFVDEKTFRVDGSDLTADKIFVCTGAHPFIPPIEGLEAVDHLTNRSVLNEMETAPDRLTILGGGYIGVEFAHFFASVGTEVTIVEAHESLVGREDEAVSQAVTEGVGSYATLHLGARATRVDEEGGEIVVQADRDGERITTHADEVLVATGRRPNTKDLGLAATGVETDERGFIAVDEHFQTSHPDILAYGDVIGRGMFKHTSSVEGKIAYQNSEGASGTLDYDKNPHAIFTKPQVGSVGLTEAQAEERGLAYRTHQAPYDATAKGDIMQARDALAKVIVEQETDRILGFHIVGPQAADLVHEVVVAMNCAKGTVANVTDAIHVHPTISELVHTVFSAV